MEGHAVTGSYQSWFERNPDLLEWEERQFVKHGLPWDIDKEAMSHGWLVVTSEVEWEGQPLPIRVEYPSEYPELPPTVFASDAIIERHQQPFAGNFCLLARPEDDWNAADWGAADLIHEQLFKLLADSAEGEDVVRANEEPMPEPQSAHYFYKPNAVVLLPGNLASPTGDGGRFRLHEFDRNRYVLAWLDDVEGDARLVSAFPKHAHLVGTWKRIERRPEGGPCGQDVLGWLRKAHPGVIKGHALPPKLRNSRHLKQQQSREIVGLVFPEEAVPDGTMRVGWMFLEVDRGTNGFLLHAQVTSEEERARRTPDLRELNERKVVVVGVGSLGGEAAVQMARASTGALRLMDHDRFEANNAVRHVLGAENAGRNKVQAVADACRSANPFCEISLDADIQFGRLAASAPLERLHQALDEADLVIETTGVHQLQLVVGRAAWELGKPMVSCWLTDGLWAGHVVRLVPGETACYLCFATRLRNEELLQGEVAPAAGAFPQGCVHPTTSGAGFDASEVVTNAVRLAVGMLTTDYPAPSWDHAVFNFRREADDQNYPRFAAERLEPNQECKLCRRDAG